MTVKGGTTPACAACKYQRRKCSPACPLAPYFPANQPKMFQNVHRLFGVSNVTKTLEKLATKEEKEDAMRSIIYEAEMRERFPVDGCCGVIAQLQHQLLLANKELHYVCANLEACRDHMVEYGGGDGVGQFVVSEENDAMMTSDLSAIQAQMEAFGIQKRDCVEFGGMQFGNGVDVFDDERQCCYVQTKNEAFESRSSLESTLDDAAEHGCRRELRSAAAGFSLTTVN